MGRDSPQKPGKRVPRRHFPAIYAALHHFKPKSFVYWTDACQATGDSGRTNQSHWSGNQPHHGSTAVYSVGRSSETFGTQCSNNQHPEARKRQREHVADTMARFCQNSLASNGQQRVENQSEWGYNIAAYLKQLVYQNGCHFSLL